MVFFALITRLYTVFICYNLLFFLLHFFLVIIIKKVNSGYTRGGRINFNCVACAIISYNSSYALYIYISM